MTYEEMARAALGFAIEDENWPIFVEWVSEYHNTPQMHDWAVRAEANPLQVQRELQREWLAHSPDEEIRNMAATWAKPKASEK